MTFGSYFIMSKEGLGHRAPSAPGAPAGVTKGALSVTKPLTHAVEWSNAPLGLLVRTSDRTRELRNLLLRDSSCCQPAMI